jgi:hypothetical protein
MRFIGVCRSWIAWSIALPLASCATYEEDLMRGQHAFEQSEHERALAILRALEPDTPRLSVVGRAHYAYLRGMTDYRIGYKVDARHWLAFAAAIEQENPGSLPPDWAKRMNDSLKELNEAVYASGMDALSNDSSQNKAKSPDEDDTSAAPKPAPKTDGQ